MDTGELRGGDNCPGRLNGLNGGIGDVIDVMGGLTDVTGSGDEELEGLSSIPELGFSRFSFCLRLQNHTRTTSLSMLRLSETKAISSLVGLGFWLKALSRAILIVVSMEVRFFLRLLIASCCACVSKCGLRNWFCW